MFKYLLSSVTLGRSKGSTFLSSHDTAGRYIDRAALARQLANLVSLPSCRLFYGVSMRISFESETCLIHSKYIFANRVTKKKHKSSPKSIDFKIVNISLESVFCSAHQTLG